MRFGFYQADSGKTWLCSDCDQRTRDIRNCHNKEGYLEQILQGKDEWLSVPPTAKHAVKVGDIKFMACPISAITQQTWDVLGLVNECTNTDGDLLHMPFEGCLSDQPPWFRSAVKIVKTERGEYLTRKNEDRKNVR